MRGEDAATSAFFAAALVATSVGITSAVLAELGAVRTRPGRTILGAAVVDDILAILVLAVAVGIAEDGSRRRRRHRASRRACRSPSSASSRSAADGSCARRPGLLTAPRFADSPLLPAVLLCLGLAVVAGEIGLAGIIGAFLAGMVIAESPDREAVENEVGPLYAFFPPFFFAAIGIQLDLDALADAVDAPAAARRHGARRGDEARGRLARRARAWARRDALVVGVGMIPRGEVGIIVASIGAAEGVVTDRLFAVIVGMAVLTTLIVPPVLRVLLQHRDDLRRRSVPAALPHDPRHRPPGRGHPRQRRPDPRQRDRLDARGGELFERRGRTFTHAHKLELVGSAGPIAAAKLERMLDLDAGAGPPRCTSSATSSSRSWPAAASRCPAPVRCIAALTRRGIPFALCSNSPRRVVDAALRGVGPHGRVRGDHRRRRGRARQARAGPLSRRGRGARRGARPTASRSRTRRPAPPARARRA